MDLRFAPDCPRLVGVSLRPSPFRFVVLLAFALTLQASGLAQHGIGSTSCP